MIAEKVKASSELPREEASETSKESLHVIPRKDGWAVKRTGPSRALRVFGTQREAIAFARDFLSGKVPHEVVVHKKRTARSVSA
jgi:hypothetical protein